jgi:hypothetical protein
MKQPGDADWSEFNDPEIINWKRVRSAIEHENELTNHRLTWLLTSQAFLFAAFTYAFQASTQITVTPELRPTYRYILAGISVTGILVNGYLSRGVHAAQHQHERLVAWWTKDRAAAELSKHPPIAGDDPRLFFTLHYYTFPFVFWVAWFIFIIAVLSDYILPYANRIGVVLLGIVVVIGLVSVGYWRGHRHVGRPRKTNRRRQPHTD